MARAAGLRDPGAAVMAAGELANNCIEHGGDSELASARGGLLRIGCGPGRLSLQFENDCEQRPDWRTRSPPPSPGSAPAAMGCRSPVPWRASVNYRWRNGRVFVRAEIRVTWSFYRKLYGDLCPWAKRTRADRHTPARPALPYHGTGRRLSGARSQRGVTRSGASLTGAASTAAHPDTGRNEDRRWRLHDRARSRSWPLLAGKTGGEAIAPATVSAPGPAWRP